jgi:hypothetical protein
MSPRRRAGSRVAKPFDAAMKELVGLDPATWLAHFGVRPSGPVSMLTTDLAGTVLAEADQVLHVDGPTPWLVQLEFQASRDPTLASRLHFYSTLLERRYGLPVQSLVALLRPEADAADLAGRLERHLPDGRVYLTFGYDVARIWEEPVEAVLAGPLATLPLAPLTRVSPVELAGILRRIEERVRQEAAPAAAERLRAGTYLLLGLRYPEDMIDDLLRGVGSMAEALKYSSTYQKILAEGMAEGRARGEAEGRARGEAEGRARGMAEGRAEGRAEEARRLLLRLGAKRFGQPDARIIAALDRMRDPERLEELAERVVEITGWDDLDLGPPEV